MPGCRAAVAGLPVPGGLDASYYTFKRADPTIFIARFASSAREITGLRVHGVLGGSFGSGSDMTADKRYDLGTFVSEDAAAAAVDAAVVDLGGPDIIMRKQQQQPLRSIVSPPVPSAGGGMKN